MDMDKKKELVVVVMDTTTPPPAAEETSTEKDGDDDTNVPPPLNLHQMQHAMFPMGAYQQYSQTQQHSLTQPMNLFGNFNGNYNPYYSHHATSRRPASAPTLPGVVNTTNVGVVPTKNQTSDNSSVNNNGNSRNKKKKKTTTPKPPTKGKGKGGGHANKFSVAEDKCLLEAMERYKPIGNINWTSTVNYYNQTRPPARPQRDQASIARRFNILHQTKAPTGDPNIPETIREAIRIQAAIVAKAEMKSMNGPCSSDDNEFENPFLTEDDDDNDDNDDMEDEDDDNAEDTQQEEEGRRSSSSSAKKKRKVTPKQRTTKTKSDTPKFSKKGGISDVLEFLVTQERLQSERDKRRDKRMEKRERLKAKREDCKMKMMLGILGKGINTLAKRKEDRVNVEALLLDSSSSDDNNSSNESSDEQEDTSSVSDRDSPPTKRRKLSKHHGRVAGPKTTGEDDDDDD